MGIFQLPVTLLATKPKVPGQVSRDAQHHAGLGYPNLTRVQTLGQAPAAHLLSLVCTEESRLPLPGYPHLKCRPGSLAVSGDDSLLMKMSRMVGFISRPGEYRDPRHGLFRAALLTTHSIWSLVERSVNQAKHLGRGTFFKAGLLLPLLPCSVLP